VRVTPVLAQVKHDGSFFFGSPEIRQGRQALWPQDSSMRTARLERPIQGQDVPVGPTEHVLMVGKFLQLADGTEIAIHQGGLFMRNGVAYIALQVDTPVEILFGHTEFPSTESFGAYPGLRVINSTLWVGKPPKNIVAHFDEMLSAWHIDVRPCIGMNRMTIRPASPKG
jgi:hypothetical protein